MIDYAVTLNSCVNGGACLGLNTRLVCRYKAKLLNQSLQRFCWWRRTVVSPGCGCIIESK